MIIRNLSEQTLPVAGVLLAPGETMQTVEGQTVDRFVEAWIAGGALRMEAVPVVHPEAPEALTVEVPAEPSWRNRLFGQREE